MKKETDYEKYLKSTHWSRIKTVVKSVRRTCEACSSGLDLHVHHKTYKRLGGENMEDLTLLCQGCHKMVHEVQKNKKITIPVATRFVINKMKSKTYKTVILPPAPNWSYRKPQPKKKKKNRHGEYWRKKREAKKRKKWFK